MNTQLNKTNPGSNHWKSAAAGLSRRNRTRKPGGLATAPFALKTLASAVLLAMLSMHGAHAADLGGTTGAAGNSGAAGANGVNGVDATGNTFHGTSGTNAVSGTAGTSGAGAVTSLTTTGDLISAAGVVAGGAGGSAGAGGIGGNGGNGRFAVTGAGGNGGNAGGGAAGGDGGVGISGAGFGLSNLGTVRGGGAGNGSDGGAGGTAGLVGGYYSIAISTGTTGANGGGGGDGGAGGLGGAGLIGTGFAINNSGTLAGGGGGRGGMGGDGKAGSAGGYGYHGGTGGNGAHGGTAGSGGAGGAAVNGSGLSVTNAVAGIIMGGAGGMAGNGGTGGNAGNAGGGYYNGTQGNSGYSRPGGVGGAGGSAISGGAGTTVSNSGFITGGLGGGGGTGGGGVSGGIGGLAGNGVAGTSLNLVNNVSGSIAGGAGGAGGTGGLSGSGASGAAGGNAVSGTSMTIANNGVLAGGAGGGGGNGGAARGLSPGGTGGAGGAGGAAVTGNAIMLVNNGMITGGNGGAGGAGGSVGRAAGAEGNGAEAIRATGNSTIINAGTISAGRANQGAGSSANAINFSGGGNKLVISAGSIINGNVVSISGNTNGGDVLALGGDANAAGGNAFELGQVGAAAQYRGFSRFNKEGGSLWTLIGSGGASGDTWTVSAGTLALATSVSVVADVTIGSAAELNGATSTIIGNLVNNGLLSVGSPLATSTTLAVTGNFTQAAGAVFRTNLSGAGPSYSRLTVSGNATLASGTTVDVNVAGSAVLANNARLPDVIKAGGTLARGSINVTDNSYLFNFVADTARDPKAVDLISVAAQVEEPMPAPGPSPVPAPAPSPAPAPVVLPSPQPVQPPAVVASPALAPAAPSVTTAVRSNGNAPSDGLAQVLDKLIVNGADDADMRRVITVLGTLPSAQSVSGAASQTLPLQTGANSMATTSALRSMNRIIQSRIESNRGLSSGDTFAGDKYVWFKPFASRATQGDRNGVTGFESDTNGLTVGMDLPATDRLRAGGVLTYADTNVQSNASAPGTQKTDVQTYALVGYASYNLDPQTDINAQLDVGYNKNKGRRAMPFIGRVAASDYGSFTTHASLGIGRVLPLSEATNLTPSIRLDHTQVRSDAYTETGAGALNLAVGKSTFKETLLSVDLKLAHALNDNIKLVANAAAAYDVSNQAAQSTAAYVGGGAAFVAKGIQPSPWLNRVGLGLLKTDQRGVEYQVRYDAEKRTTDFLNHTLSARIRVPF